MLDGSNFTMVIIGIIVLVTLVMKIFVVIQEYERGVMFTLGKAKSTELNPGINLRIPGVQRIVKIDQRIITMDVPSQDVITKDNITIKVNAVLYYRVFDTLNSVLKVENYHYATSQIAQTTLRSVCGEVDLDELLANREQINLRIQEIIDAQTDPWGVKVSTVEVKHIDLPQVMQRAMAKQAEAERDRRSRIILAEGEYQASETLLKAAQVMSKDSTALQLRYLETLRDISTENNSTIIFPLPIDLVTVFQKTLKKDE